MEVMDHTTQPSPADNGQNSSKAPLWIGLSVLFSVIIVATCVAIAIFLSSYSRKRGEARIRKAQQPVSDSGVEMRPVDSHRPISVDIAPVPPIPRAQYRAMTPIGENAPYNATLARKTPPSTPRVKHDGGNIVLQARDEVYRNRTPVSRAVTPARDIAREEVDSERGTPPPQRFDQLSAASQTQTKGLTVQKPRKNAWVQPMGL